MRSINARETRSRRLYSADMIIPFATICLVSVWIDGASSRVPPKFVKAVNGVGKALYAGRYGYSMVPIPPHILVQSNIARKEVHLPPRFRKKRRPPPRRPYANQFREYSYKKKQRRPVKRPPPPVDYYDEEEIEEEPEYEYEERPKKQKDFEDFVAQHSELYSSGYNPGRKKYRDTEERKPFKISGSRPSNKLYSAAINSPSRPVFLREDEEEERPRIKKQKKRYEEEDEDDDVYHDRAYEAKQKRRERGTEEKDEKWSKPMEGWTPGDKDWAQTVNIRWIEPKKKEPEWIEPPEKWTQASPDYIEPTAPSSWTKWRNTSRYEPEEKTTPKPKRRKNKNRVENHKDDIVAQRVVGGMVQYDDTKKQKHFDNVHEEGEIVYGSRINDQKSWRKELDIGFGQGMELMNDKIVGWQVY